MSDWAGSPHDRYCEHGTPIGDPFGPDYLCGYCEEGVSMDEFIVIQQANSRRHRIDAAARAEGVIFRRVVECYQGGKFPFDARKATLMVVWAMDKHEQFEADIAAYDALVGEQMALSA